MVILMLSASCRLPLEQIILGNSDMLIFVGNDDNSDIMVLKYFFFLPRFLFPKCLDQCSQGKQWTLLLFTWLSDSV